MLARCSGDNYFPMVDVLFKQQMQWAGVENAKDALLQIAKLAGFSQEKFEACLTDQKLLDDVRAVREPRAEGIRRRLDADLLHQWRDATMERCRLRKCRRSSTHCSDAAGIARACRAFAAPGRARMKFNRLRLLGFKSFVEPAEFVIERGLTGVVGPNGCGKSNLVEALRWVMGESSYKNMRASGMDDVIFSGSATRPVAQHRRGDAVPRQWRPHRARRLQRCRRIAGVAPHRARGRLDLPHQRQGSARQGRAAAVCRPVDRRALAVDGRAGPHRRADPGQAAGAPRAARGGRRHLRPAHPPPRGRASGCAPPSRTSNGSTTSSASSKARSKA